MKLVISKGLANIQGTTAEADKIERVAAKMQATEELMICDGGDDTGEYWVDLTYDARDHTIEAIKQIYREAKQC